MKIRKFRSRDSKAVSEIMITAFKSFLGDKLDEWELQSFSPDVLRKVSNSKSHDGEVVSYVAEEKGKILGYIRGSAKMCGLGCLEVVGVAPDCLREGVGTELVKELERFWKRGKMRKVHTCTSAHNTRALIFYIKNGFIPEGCQKEHFKPGVDEIVLGKFL